jgi:hypothetical protein
MEQNDINQEIVPTITTSGVPLDRLVIPYRFSKNGYNYSLIGVGNNFARRGEDAFEYAEYENQYGHIKKLNRHQLLEV